MMSVFRKMKISVLLFAAAVMMSCGLIPEEETFQDVPYVGDYESEDYSLSQCIRMDIEVKVKVSVKYVPLQTVSMSFEVGSVPYGDIYTAVGESVQEGDLLLELDTDQLLKNVAKEEESIETNDRKIRQLEENRTLELRLAEYRASSTTYERYLQNVDQINSRYDQQVEALRDANEVSGLRIEAYEEDIRKRQIRAPFDGVITYVINPDPDALSQANKRVVTIADSSLSLFKGSTDCFSLFEPGLECTVVSGGSEFEAVVRSEEELGLPETSHVEGKAGTIYLALRETVYTLNDNASGTVTLTQAKKSNVLCVPKKAVSEINGKTVVYYPDEYGLRAYKEIKIGLDNGSYVEVISGLEEGDTVIIR